MNPEKYGDSQVVRGIVHAMGEMLGTRTTTCCTTPTVLQSICHSIVQMDKALHFEMFAGDYASLSELASNRTLPVAMRQQAAKKMIRHVRQLIAQGKSEQAVLLAEHAFAMWSDVSGIGAMVGSALYSLGKTQQALQWFERDAEWSAIQNPYSLRHCMVRMELHDYDSARIILNLLRDMPHSKQHLPRLQHLLLTMLLSEGRAFVKGSLSHLLRSATLAPDEPLMSAALLPYSLFLMRRMESPTVNQFDSLAAKLIASAMLEEHEFAAYQGDHLITLGRWLILTGRPESALRLISDETQRNAAFADGFAYLCLFLWISGKDDMARDCLPKMDCTSPTSVVGWFARSVACAVAGDLVRASECMATLYREQADYFLVQKGTTTWGMLSLACKALGHDALARTARSLAIRQDPFDHYRSNLLERVVAPSVMHAIPPFKLPEIIDPKDLRPMATESDTNAV